MRHVLMITLAAGVLAVFGAPVSAQMKDAASIRPILEATKANWIAVRDWQGQDLLYFTHLETWKCGLSAIHFGINGASAETAYEFELCAEDEAAPSPLGADRLPYLTFDQGVIENVTITITYDDGATATETYERAAVQIP